MAECAELSVVLSLFLHLLEFLLDGLDQKLLGLDLGNLDVAVRVSVCKKLSLDLCREAVEDLSGIGGELSFDECDLCGNRIKGVELLFGLSKQVVDLADQGVEGGDELDQAFRYEDDTEVVSVLSTLCDDVGDVGCDLLDALVLGLDFLSDEADVRLCLESALECDVACASAHESDEVPVLAG